jgi:hypothetical protein
MSKHYFRLCKDDNYVINENNRPTYSVYLCRTDVGYITYIRGYYYKQNGFFIDMLDESMLYSVGHKLDTINNIVELYEALFKT